MSLHIHKSCLYMSKSCPHRNRSCVRVDEACLHSNVSCLHINKSCLYINEETWGAGVVILTVDTPSSLFEFRTHFLDQIVPIKY